MTGHLTVFVIAILAGLSNAVNSAIELNLMSGWFLFHFPAMFICGYMAYYQFWWAIFRMNAEPYEKVWPKDGSARVVWMEKAFEFYEERDLANAMDCLKKAQQADLTRYDSL